MIEGVGDGLIIDRTIGSDWSGATTNPPSTSVLISISGRDLDQMLIP